MHDPAAVQEGEPSRHATGDAEEEAGRRGPLQRLQDSRRGVGEGKEEARRGVG